MMNSGKFACLWTHQTTNVCNMLFDSMDELWKHLELDHVGFKRYGQLCLKCHWDDCGVEPKRKRDNLISHLRTHFSDYRPFVCHICDHGCHRDHELRKHLLQKHNIIRDSRKNGSRQRVKRDPDTTSNGEDSTSGSSCHSPILESAMSAGAQVDLNSVKIEVVSPILTNCSLDLIPVKNEEFDLTPMECDHHPQYAPNLVSSTLSHALGPRSETFMHSSNSSQFDLLNMAPSNHVFPSFLLPSTFKLPPLPSPALSSLSSEPFGVGSLETSSYFHLPTFNSPPSSTLESFSKTGNDASRGQPLAGMRMKEDDHAGDSGFDLWMALFAMTDSQ